MRCFPIFNYAILQNAKHCADVASNAVNRPPLPLALYIFSKLLLNPLKFTELVATRYGMKFDISNMINFEGCSDLFVPDWSRFAQQVEIVWHIYIWCIDTIQTYNLHIYIIVAHTVAVMNHREQRNTLCMTHKDMEQLQEIYQMSTPYETVHEVTR